MSTLKQLFPTKGNLVGFIFIVIFLLSSFGEVFIPSSGLYKPEPVGAFLNNNLPSSTPSNGGGNVNWSVVPAFPNLSFNNPLVMTMYPDPSIDVMFVASRLGGIEYFNTSDPTVSTKNTFGDFTAETAVVHDGGFLGMEFHPDFATNPNRRWVYLFYIANGPHVFNGQSQANNGPYSCDCECFSCATTGRWYGSYLRLARYDVTGTLATGLSIDKTSEKRMINIRLYNATHRGGGIVFGDDGYLYATIGDQARRTTAQGITKAADNTEGVNMFEGGVLRLDVNIDNPSPNSHAPTYVIGPEINVPMRDYDNNCSGTDPVTIVAQTEDVTGAFYRIPNDNPQWYTNSNPYFEEFITIGHRAPHRMTKDKLTSDLWIGEVGAGSREEINVLQPDLLIRNGGTTQGGGNYGWPKREGFLVGNFGACGSNNITLNLGPIYDPVVDFPRNGAKGSNAIMGGYVYRGSKFASQLGGRYICGGYSQNRIFAIDFKKDGNGTIVADFPQGGTYRDAIEELTSFTPGQLITWGEDHEGELYMGKIGSNVNLYTLSATGIGDPAPEFLSQTGAFEDLATLTPKQGIIPYELIEPFWSDNAEKYRWIAVPNDGKHDTAAEQINFSENENWQYPTGTVLIKHFELETSPGVFKRLETRFEVLGTDDNYYYLTYKWNAAGTDAELLTGGLDENITVNGQNQVWHYPSGSECLTCHQTSVGSVLGPNTRNLNQSITYPSTGITANQLITLSHLGILDQTITEAETATYLSLAAKDDTDVPIEFRARSYIDVNCGYCHQPATGNRANFDARITTGLSQQNLVNGSVQDNLGISGATYIFPQSVVQSIIHHRMEVLTTGIAMPPLAKNKVDDEGVQLIADWINSLQPTPPPASQPGLMGNYFDGIDLQDQKFTQIDPNINFQWDLGSPNTAELGNDQFSIRWTGLVKPQYAQTYTFYTTTDDGIRLWINGQLIIDQWVPQAPTEHSGTITLAAEEEVSLVMEYYEAGGGAVAELRWSSPSQTKQIIPASRLSHIPDVVVSTDPGLIGNYFDGMNFQTQKFTQIDANIDFSWGSGSPNAGELGNDLFSVRWTGLVKPEYSETYTFYTTSDDGVRLWINGQQIVNQWVDQGTTEHSGTISLTAGQDVSLAMEYYENAGGAVAQLRWSSPSQVKQIIPASRLSHISTSSACGSGGPNNDAPVAVFKTSTSMGGFPLKVDFDASTSYDPNDDAITLAWDFDDGQTGSGFTPSHTFLNPGVYDLTLTVEDAFGCTDTETIPVNVINNGAPTLALSATPTTGDAPLVVLFEANTTDPENDPLTYHWDFGDGSTRMGITPGATHTYNYPGIYEAVLTINDGFTDVQATETITVDHAYSDLGIFVKNEDVGAVGATGSSNHIDGDYTIIGSGIDISNIADEFQFIYRPYQEYGEIVARVVSVTNTDESAKAGVMFRESTDSGAPFVMIAVRPDNQVVLQWRLAGTSPDNVAMGTGLVGGTADIKYIRLQRLGDCFAGYYSTVGPEGPWIQIGSEVVIDMSENALVGLATNSHNDGVLATAQYDNVQLNSLEPAIAVFVKSKIILQGAWDGTEMNTTLANATMIPLDQPYDALPADYLGNESINVYPPNMVDWMLVQIRDANDPTCVIAQRACFVRNDGMLMDLDGTEGVDFGLLEIDAGYVALLHRNHLGVMTQDAVVLK